MMKTLLGAAVFAVAACWVTPALSQEDAAPSATAQSLEPEKLEPGARVRVTGKYKELLDKELNLFDCKLRFLIKQKENLKQILDFKAQRDNVTIAGTLVTSDSGPAIEVEEILPAPSDLEVFTREEETFKSTGNADRKGLSGLVKKILTTCARFDERDLIPLALRVFNESLGTEGEALDPAGVEDRIETVRQIYRLSKDTDMALEAALNLEKRCGQHDRIERLLHELNCRKHGGKWVTYAEFKRGEGFVERGGRWITPREQQMIDFTEALRAQKQTNLILRKRTDREYHFLSEKGALEEGMKPEEVCVAMGFPDRVERRTVDGKELDQWCYGNKACYFYGGILVKKPDP